jgi:hypothetical protein
MGGREGAGVGDVIIKMAIKQRPIAKCDQCGKEVEFADGHLPDHWLEIDVTEWMGSSGEGRFKKEVCSEKCVINMMHNVKKIPKKVYTVL